mmetsp:Transcript_76977/g.213964  ORF Transcript_76977/g.213964 Transcript_76977/m.213964 type:complete len:209 (-) Transcript_76977:116-742(-)
MVGALSSFRGAIACRPFCMCWPLFCMWCGRASATPSNGRWRRPNTQPLRSGLAGEGRTRPALMRGSHTRIPNCSRQSKACPGPRCRTPFRRPRPLPPPPPRRAARLATPRAPAPIPLWRICALRSSSRRQACRCAARRTSAWPVLHASCKSVKNSSRSLVPRTAGTWPTRVALGPRAVLCARSAQPKDAGAGWPASGLQTVRPRLVAQ